MTSCSPLIGQTAGGAAGRAQAEGRRGRGLHRGRGSQQRVPEAVRLNILLPNFLLGVCKICDVMLIPLLQSRLKSELKKLRKKYEKETEISKREFMHVHSKQVNRISFLAL